MLSFLFLDSKVVQNTKANGWIYKNPLVCFRVPLNLESFLCLYVIRYFKTWQNILINI